MGIVFLVITFISGMLAWILPLSMKNAAGDIAAYVLGGVAFLGFVVGISLVMIGRDNASNMDDRLYTASGEFRGTDNLGVSSSPYSQF